MRVVPSAETRTAAAMAEARVAAMAETGIAAAAAAAASG